MYPRNAPVPPTIPIGAIVQISDGVVQLAGVSVTVFPEGGIEAAGLGPVSYGATGIVRYAPTQAETNYPAFTVTASKTGCIPVPQLIVTTASPIAGLAASDLTHIGGQSIATNSATLKLKKLEIINPDGTGSSLKVQNSSAANSEPAALIQHSGNTNSSAGLSLRGASGTGFSVSSTTNKAASFVGALGGLELATMNSGPALSCSGGIAADITGNVSGSVGSVAGLTASDVGAIKAVADKLNTTLVQDGVVYDFTAAALAAGGGGGATVEDMIAGGIAKESTSQIIKTKTDTIPAGIALESTVAARPTLQAIEGSTVLAKAAALTNVINYVDSVESTLATLVSMIPGDNAEVLADIQAAIAAIPVLDLSDLAEQVADLHGMTEIVGESGRRLTAHAVSAMHASAGELALVNAQYPDLVVAVMYQITKMITPPAPEDNIVAVRVHHATDLLSSTWPVFMELSYSPGQDSVSFTSSTVQFFRLSYVDVDGAQSELSDVFSAAGGYGDYNFLFELHEDSLRWIEGDIKFLTVLVTEEADSLQSLPRATVTVWDSQGALIVHEAPALVDGMQVKYRLNSLGYLPGKYAVSVTIHTIFEQIQSKRMKFSIAAR